MSTTREMEKINKVRDDIQRQVDKAEIEKLKKLLIDVTAHDADLRAYIKDIESVIFIEMPGMNLDLMGEKYYSKIRSIIGKALNQP